MTSQTHILEAGLDGNCDPLAGSLSAESGNGIGYEVARPGEETAGDYDGPCEQEYHIVVGEDSKGREEDGGEPCGYLALGPGRGRTP